jgi:hypothetical protein
VARNPRTYEIMIGPAALLVIIRLTQPAKDELAAALGDELESSPNPRTLREYAGVMCTNLILSTGHLAVYNALTSAELNRHHPERGRRLHRKGYYIFDILSPDLGVLQTSQR